MEVCSPKIGVTFNGSVFLNLLTNSGFTLWSSSRLRCGSRLASTIEQGDGFFSSSFYNMIDCWGRCDFFRLLSETFSHGLVVKTPPPLQYWTPSREGDTLFISWLFCFYLLMDILFLFTVSTYFVSHVVFDDTNYLITSAALWPLTSIITFIMRIRRKPH